MKKITIIVLALSLFLTACSSNTEMASSQNQESTQQSETAPPQENVEDAKAPRQNNDRKPSSLGKITAVTDTEITLTLAEMQQREQGQQKDRPDRSESGSTEGEDDAQPERSAPKNGEANGERGNRPAGERPNGGGPQDGGEDGRRGGFIPSAEQFTGESKTYTFATELKITKSDSEDELTVSDIFVDDIIQFEINENSEITTIRIMPMPNIPAASDSSQEEASESEAEVSTEAQKYYKKVLIFQGLFILRTISTELIIRQRACRLSYSLFASGCLFLYQLAKYMYYVIFS